MLASDDHNPNFVGARNPDSVLSVRFYSKPVQNMYKTQQEGRPIFEDTLYVTIWTPGNDKNIIDTPVRGDHKNRFPLQWAAYQNTHGADTREMGTPVSAWPLLTAAQAEELKAVKFFTVEHIANASDQQISSVGMIAGMAPLAFRSRAQAFLAAAADSAVPQKQAEEIERLKQEAKEREERHAQDMAELKAMVQTLAANQKGKPGRKKQEVASA